MFAEGQTYNRGHLHELYGGQQQGGISTPADHNFIMLFTGEQGEQYGYKDGWSDDGIFFYTGEGQVGDMTFVRGNRAVREHVNDGKDVHLLNYVKPGRVRYIGQMICTGYHTRQAPDIKGNPRQVIVFELVPIGALDGLTTIDQAEEEELWTEPLGKLRALALDTAQDGRKPSERKQQVRYRSRAVRAYVLRRAEGRCEGCGEEAPFTTEDGRPYLEPHHIRRLSDGGPDHPGWVAALCPNCHRRAHYSQDCRDFNSRLAEIVHKKERLARR